MTRGLLSASGRVRPFGFVRNRREADDELDHAGEWGARDRLLPVLDLLTLPLAVFLLGERRQSM